MDAFQSFQYKPISAKCAKIKFSNFNFKLTFMDQFVKEIIHLNAQYSAIWMYNNTDSALTH